MASGTLETDTGVSGTFVHFPKVVVTVCCEMSPLTPVFAHGSPAGGAVLRGYGKWDIAKQTDVGHCQDYQGSSLAFSLRFLFCQDVNDPTASSHHRGPHFC